MFRELRERVRRIVLPLTSSDPNLERVVSRNNDAFCRDTARIMAFFMRTVARHLLVCMSMYLFFLSGALDRWWFAFVKS